MKKSIVTLGILCCMLAGCQNKSQETTGMCEQENQVVKTIMERRSIRNYKPQPVEREKMDLILQCGINTLLSTLFYLRVLLGEIQTCHFLQLCFT